MIPKISYDFNASIWLYTGKSAWHFITLPEPIAKQIKANISGPRRGWGSLRVSVTIGNSTWKTSIFPYSGVNSFILPIKASVRKQEHLKVGNSLKIAITVLE